MFLGLGGEAICFVVLGLGCGRLSNGQLGLVSGGHVFAQMWGVSYMELGCKAQREAECKQFT